MANRPPAVVQGSSLRQAYSLTELGQFTEALQVLDVYLGEAPQDKRGWVLRAHVMLTMGNPQGALDSIERVTHIDPADPMPWVIQGTALSTMGDYASALHSLENALVADPDNRDAQELRKTVLERIQMQERELRTQQLFYELGELQYRMGRHDEALPNLERSLRRDPHDAAAWGLKACVLWALGRQQEAVDCISRSIELRGEDDWAYGVRGTMHKDLGHFDAALRDVEAALRLNPAREDLVAVRRAIEAERQTMPPLPRAEPQAPRPSPTTDLPASARGGPPSPAPQAEQMTMRVDAAALALEAANMREDSAAVRIKRLELPVPAPPTTPPQMESRPVSGTSRKSGRIRTGSATLPGPAPNAPSAPTPAELPLEQVKAARLRPQPAETGVEPLRKAMEEAHHCYARNDYRAAAALYEKIADQAVSRDRHMAALAWLYRARCHYALREFEQALTCYEAVARLSPDNPSWLEHGLTLRHLGRYEDASVQFDRCIQGGHNVDTAWVQKGHCALHLKKTDQAIVCYQHATEVNPRNAHAWFSLAQSLTVAGKLQGAYEAVTRGLTVDVRSASGLELLGDILCLLGRLGEARTAFEKVVELDPSRTHADQCVRALSAQPNAVPEPVTKRFARIPREKPKAEPEPVRAGPTAPDRLAPVRSLIKGYRFEEAWTQLQSLLPPGRGTGSEQSLRATVLIELGRYEEAVASAQDAVRMDPSSFEPHYELARALTHLKRYPDAVREAEAALKARPRDAEAWALRGVLKAQLGDADEARRCFETAANYDPQNSQAVVRQATAMDVLGYPEAALDLYQKALRLAPKNADAMAEMAVTLAALGRRSEALSLAEQALQINPFQVQALEWSARLKHVAAPAPAPEQARKTAMIPPSEVPPQAGPPIMPTRKHQKADLTPLQTSVELPSPVEAPIGGPPTLSTRRKGQNLDGASQYELLRMARDQYDKGDYEESIGLYDRVLRQDDTVSTAWFGKGLCYSALWIFDKARECMDRSAKLPEPPTEQLGHARKRQEAMAAFYEQSIKPLLAKELRAWRIFVAPSGAFRVPYPSWCQTFPPSTSGELAHIADRTEKPTFVFTVTAQPFVDARDLTMVKHGERVVDEGELPHPQAVVDYKEVRDRNKGTFSLRAVLIKGHMAWYLVGTARFQYYAGYRQLFQMMVTDFFLA